MLTNKNEQNNCKIEIFILVIRNDWEVLRHEENNRQKRQTKRPYFKLRVYYLHIKI